MENKSIFLSLEFMNLKQTKGNVEKREQLEGSVVTISHDFDSKDQNSMSSNLSYFKDNSNQGFDHIKFEQKFKHNIEMRGVLFSPYTLLGISPNFKNSLLYEAGGGVDIKTSKQILFMTKMSISFLDAYKTVENWDKIRGLNLRFGMGYRF